MLCCPSPPLRSRSSSSWRSTRPTARASYHSAVKPFVDAVNAEAKGLIEIEVHFSGALGKSQAQQPQLVLDGVADIAFVIPGMVPGRFSDNAVIELPGLYRSMREATLTYTRLIAANALRGYDEFFVIGAYGSELESIHARPPVTSLASLKGKKIRSTIRPRASCWKSSACRPW